MDKISFKKAKRFIYKYDLIEWIFCLNTNKVSLINQFKSDEQLLNRQFRQYDLDLCRQTPEIVRVLLTV